MTRCLLFSDRAIAYSATTVFPADVWADTRTDWLFSMHKIASRWNGSKTNLYSFAGGVVGWMRGAYGWPESHVNMKMNFIFEAVKQSACYTWINGNFMCARVWRFNHMHRNSRFNFIQIQIVQNRFSRLRNFSFFNSSFLSIVIFVWTFVFFQWTLVWFRLIISKKREQL